MSTIILEISDLSRGGSGVGRDATGRVVFVPYTAPGDQVRVEIVEAEKRYAQGRLLEVIRPSSARISPKCPAFGSCGGCQWQHLPYELQWKTKVGGVQHALKRVGIELRAPLEELPAERIWEYRNRVQLRGEGTKIGFYEAGSTRLVPIDRCDIARPEINAVWEELRTEGARRDRPYKVEVEVSEDGEVRQSWNRGHAALGFRQVHDEQNEKLRNWVRGAIRQSGGIYDLFGGYGNLSLAFANEDREIHCVDLGVPSAEERPERLSSKYRFHRAKVAPWLIRWKQLGKESEGSWSAILDPPREGLADDFAEIASALERLRVTELIAVGCDPDAWVRDLSRFLRRGWEIQNAAVLDLFPQTPHVESLARLEFRERTLR